MRKSVIFLFAAMGLLAGCAKEVAQDTLSEKVTLQVGIAPATRTHMGDLADGAHKVYWSDGDKIAVNGVASEALAEVGDAATQANFSFDALEGAPYNVLYPADIWADATHVTLPAVQTYESGGFADGMFPMAAYSADGIGIAMKHLCAVVKVNVLRALDGDDDKLVAARFQGNANEQVSGSFSINYADATLSGASSAAADKVVKVVKVLTTATDKAVSYYIVVPAITYSAGFSIIVQDASGDAQTVTKASSATLEAGKLYNMAEFSFVPNGTAPATLEIASAEDLIAFATAYNNKEYQGQDDLVVELTQDITFNATQSAAFNATGGIGMMNGMYGAAETFYFNGLFNGNNHSINGLAATVPVFAGIGKNGTVRNLVLGSTSSVTYSAAVSAANLYLGAIVGINRGNTIDCSNYAPVSCQTTSYSKPLYIGGVVGGQIKLGSISGCHNYAAISCTATGGADKVNVYIGGVVGSVERQESSDNATIDNSSNSGDITANPENSVFLHVGGVIGWINSENGKSSRMTITGLVNTGDVTRTNAGQKNDYPVLAAGLIGGIHGSTISTKTGQVDIKDSHVSDCTVQNGSYNNKQGYGTASHTAGFVGVARGDEGSKNIIFSDNCYVDNVLVICRRGFAGGFVSWTRGAQITDCSVINSSVRGSLAQCWYAGGMAGCAFDSSISNCMVKLTKEDTQGNAYDSYTLYANGNGNNSTSSSVAGGIAAQVRGTTTIDNCKAFIKKMYQGTSGKEAFRGWIAGFVDDNSGSDSPSLTIKNCAIGGACASAPAVTIDSGNVMDYLYGSVGAKGTVSLEGTQSYWDGTIE